MAGRKILVGTGSVLEGPTIRKRQFLISPILNKIEEPNLRRTATIKRVPFQQQNTEAPFIGIKPGATTLPEDGRRYEVKINDKDGETKYEFMMDPNGKENKKGYVRYTRVNYDGSKDDIVKSFSPSMHNRVLVSTLFKDYNSEKNKYKALENREFLSRFSDIDTDEDIKAFNNLYK